MVVVAQIEKNDHQNEMLCIVDRSSLLVRVFAFRLSGATNYRLGNKRHLSAESNQATPTCQTF